MLDVAIAAGPLSWPATPTEKYHSAYLEIPRCGHLILFELPEQVTLILRLFLRGAERREQGRPAPQNPASRQP